jgi:hypothetical protein
MGMCTVLGCGCRCCEFFAVSVSDGCVLAVVRSIFISVGDNMCVTDQRCVFEFVKTTAVSGDVLRGVVQ